MPDKVGPLYPFEGLSQRQPPCNIKAEQAFLGALLANNKVLDLVGDSLKPEHFFDPIHGRIYTEACRRIVAGQTADAVLMKDWFASDHESHLVGGDRYLVQLLGSMILIDGAKAYADTIIDCWRRRQVIEAATHVITESFELARPIEQSAADHASAIDAIVTDQGTALPIHLNEAVQSAVEKAVEARAQGGHKGVLIPMFPTLDRRVALMPEEFTILGGQSGEGKSALGWQMMISAAEYVRDRVLAGTPMGQLGGFVGISLEMSAEALGRRVVSAYSGVPVSDMLHGRITDEQADRLNDAHRRVKGLPLTLIAAGGLTPSMIRMRLRQAQRVFKGKIAAVIIDHLLLVNAEDKDSRAGGAWATGRVADAVLAMGKEFGCHVLGLCQLDIKDIAKRTEKRPTRADLRWSAKWADNADNILFIHRPEMYLSPSPPTQASAMSDDDFRQKLQEWQDERARLHGKAELIIDKCRHGKSGWMIPMLFDEQTITFSEDPTDR